MKRLHQLATVHDDNADVARLGQRNQERVVVHDFNRHDVVAPLVVSALHQDGVVDEVGTQVVSHGVFRGGNRGFQLEAVAVQLGLQGGSTVARGGNDGIQLSLQAGFNSNSALLFRLDGCVQLQVSILQAGGSVQEVRASDGQVSAVGSRPAPASMRLTSSCSAVSAVVRASVSAAKLADRVESSA